MRKQYPVQTVLMLACTAQRHNGGYLKPGTDQLVQTEAKWSNKELILYALGEVVDAASFLPPPLLLRPTQEDVDLAANIRSFYRRWMFAAIAGEDEFRTKVNSLLEATDMPVNDIGYLACLPSMYLRHLAQEPVRRAGRDADNGYLADIGDILVDKDCNILVCTRSKNFNAWNVDAIIDNKLVSWISQDELTVGNTVVVKAKVKDHSMHWLHCTPVTRLNYVKAYQ